MNQIIICALGVYAVTLVLSSYSGLFNVFSWWRSKLPNELRNLVTCFVCFSFWVAVPFAFVAHLNFIEYLSVVGLAIVIERFVE